MAASLYGRQEPTVRVCPDFTETHGGKADALMRIAGRSLMQWQRCLVDDWLSRTPSGTWAAPTCGASVPRQNGKTHVVACVIAHQMRAYGAWVCYTSHLQKTSTETFEELRSIFESKALSKCVKEIKQALGREEIVLTNGAKCKFLARTRNGGRGQHADLWVCDEAQELTDEQQGSFLPILAASKNPQTIYIGTPPDENAPGEVFRRVRSDALDGKTKKTAWSEWSVDEIGDTGDRSRWADANPSMGYMIRETTIEAEHEQMASDKFARERLGWWSENRRAAVIGSTAWDKCATSEPPSHGDTAFAVKFSPDGFTGSVSVCLRPESGSPHIELIESRNTDEGVAWIADMLESVIGTCSVIVVDGMSNAAPLMEELKRMGAGKRVLVKPRPADVAAACSMLLNAVNEGRVTHYAQNELDAPAKSCSKRSIGTGGGWGFSGQGDTAIESAALAYWGAMTTRRKPSRRQVLG